MGAQQPFVTGRAGWLPAGAEPVTVIRGAGHESVGMNRG
jgi:hypothetical protein